MLRLLPFRRKRLGGSVLIVNEVGQYLFILESDFSILLNNPDILSCELINNLISKNFLCEDSELEQTINELAIKLRTKKDFLNYFTTLHIIVLTHNCNSNCTYCHASSHSKFLQSDLNMDIKTARKVCETIMVCPSQEIKIEFQGGEPLLNFNTLSFIIEYIKTLNRSKKKYIEFVVCSNLLNVGEKQLDYLMKNNVFISTSIDGPEDIHDINRKSINDLSNYEQVTSNIKKILDIYGKQKVSALMTITKKSLHRLHECVDTYIELGFVSIFFRPLNPYGMVEKTKEFLSYSTAEFLNAYEDGLRYILDINIKGTFFREEFACIFLRKVLTPFSNGFVDIQSPSGNGIGCAAYDIDGNVYVSDEARMLAKLGDKTFCIGNVFSDDYLSIFNGTKLHKIVKETIVEANVSCLGCPYIPYCGKDAVRTYQEKKLGLDQTNCDKHKGIVDILFKLICEDPQFETVFWGWLTSKSYDEVIL